MKAIHYKILVLWSAFRPCLVWIYEKVKASGSEQTRKKNDPNSRPEPISEVFALSFIHKLSDWQVPSSLHRLAL